MAQRSADRSLAPASGADAAARRNGRVDGARPTLANGFLLTLVGGGLGLFASRLTLETPGLALGHPNATGVALGTPLPAPAVFAWALAGLLAGVAALFLVGRAVLRRAGIAPLLPLGLLWVYVLGFGPDPDAARTLGLAAGAAALLVWLAAAPTRSWPAPPAPLAALLAGLGAFALYLRTLAPTVQPADSGELQLVAATLGIAHPPGYPLYTLIGRLFTFLPFGDAAYRVNLLSAVSAAAAVSATAGLASELAAPRTPGAARAANPAWALAAGLIAATTFAVSATWWSQATVAAVRPLAGLSAALLLLGAVRWLRSGSERWLRALALVAGLSLTHHVPIAVFLPPIALLAAFGRPARVRALLLRPGQRSNLLLLGLFLAPLLLYLYLPLRAAQGTALDPPRPMSLDDFVAHVTARGFRGDMLHYGPAELPDRLWALGELVRAQFGAFGVAVAALGAASALLRWPLGGGLLALGWLGNTLLAITYRAPVITDYLIPSYLIMAVWIGLAPTALLDLPARLGRTARLLGPAIAWAALLAALPAALLLRNLPGLDASGDDEARRVAAGTLAAAAPGSTVLADWHHATPLWYLQHVEGLRPDLTVRYVAPRGATVPWVEEAEAALARGRTYVSSYQPELGARFQLVPAGPALELGRAALAADDVGSPRRPESRWGAPDVRPATPTPAELDGLAALIGYDLPERAVPAGGTLALTLYWQALQPIDRSLTVFVHLVDASGRPVGQRDNPPVRGAFPTTRWAPGQVVPDPYEVAILPTVPPGRYRLLAGLYEPLPGGWRRLPVQGASAAPGGEAADLGAVEVLPAAPVAPASAQRSAARFADGSVLAAWAWDRPADGPPILRLWWQTRPGPAGLALRRAGPDGRDRVERVDALAAGQLVSEHPLPEGASPWVEIELRGAGGAAQPLLGRWLLPAASGLRLPLPDRAVAPAPLDLGGRAWYLGGEPLQQRVRPGDLLVVETRWEAIGRLADDYRVFVHLRGPDGRARAGDDGVPVEGILPTLRWPPGHVVTDRRKLRLPADLPPGEYELIAGLYPAWTGLRLPVLEERRARLGQGDYVIVGRVTVE